MELRSKRSHWGHCRGWLAGLGHATKLPQGHLGICGFSSPLFLISTVTLLVTSTHYIYIYYYYYYYDYYYYYCYYYYYYFDIHDPKDW